jgi:alkanesulfonate monooxygenase SsuD/methylene tetrahydromethanopterin reductase-like flavin-dependent oxidoreductase (luciferase family)
MNYGLALAAAGQFDLHDLIDLAPLAEASGWDGIFLEDYIVWQGHQDVPAYDPWAVLAAMALRTTRVKLAILVTPLARRRPWKVAREAVTIDHLARGRLILGFGLGDKETGDPSFAHFGEQMNIKARAEMLDEGIEIVAGLLAGSPFRYDGKHYTVKEITLLPKPVQQPRIPIWIGGGYPYRGPMRRAARWDGSCLYRDGVHYLTPDDVRELREFVRAQRGTLDGYDIVVGGSPRRADWDEERAYIRALAEAGTTWWQEYVPPGELGAMREAIARGPLRID